MRTRSNLDVVVGLPCQEADWALSWEQLAILVPKDLGIVGPRLKRGQGVWRGGSRLFSKFVNLAHCIHKELVMPVGEEQSEDA
jgi:hypothetical protein